MSSVGEYGLNIHVSSGAKSYMFEVQPTDMIQSIKEKLSALTKVRANNLLLLLEGAYLENNSKVSDYDIMEDTTLAFEIKLCGPKPVDFDWSTLGVPAVPKKVTGLHHVKKVKEL